MKTIDLREKPDLRKVEVGTRVISSKGYEFELLSRDQSEKEIKERWVDLKTNVIWGPIIKESLNFNDANRKYQLPTKEEFETAERHGFREIIGISSGSFWSSSAYFDVYAWGFNGYNGHIDFGYRYYGSSNEAVLCVAGR
jgi:hypothetical protein